jgi:hypothetical protein
MVVVVVHPATRMAMQASTSRIMENFPEFISNTGCRAENRL